MRRISSQSGARRPMAEPNGLAWASQGEGPPAVAHAHEVVTNSAPRRRNHARRARDHDRVHRRPFSAAGRWYPGRQATRRTSRITSQAGRRSQARRARSMADRTARPVMVTANTVANARPPLDEHPARQPPKRKANPNGLRALARLTPRLQPRRPHDPAGRRRLQAVVRPRGYCRR